MAIDPEVILDALAGGLSIEKAAKQFRMPADDVRKILKDEIESCRDGEYLREAWALADRRLAVVELKFYNRALEGDGDSTAAMVFVKTSERRATLNGANMPQSHILQVVNVHGCPADKLLLAFRQNVHATKIGADVFIEVTEPARR